jgi:hypothetical protein
VAAAVFFLLMGVWMQELSLLGMRNAPLLGVLCLVSSALALANYRRSTSASTASVLAALGRAAHARATPKPRAAVRLVR